MFELTYSSRKAHPNLASDEFGEEMSRCAADDVRNPSRLSGGCRRSLHGEGPYCELTRRTGEPGTAPPGKHTMSGSAVRPAPGRGDATGSPWVIRLVRIVPFVREVSLVTPPARGAEGPARWTKTRPAGFAADSPSTAGRRAGFDPSARRRGRAGGTAEGGHRRGSSLADPIPRRSLPEPCGTYRIPTKNELPLQPVELYRLKRIPAVGGTKRWPRRKTTCPIERR